MDKILRVIWIYKIITMAKMHCSQS